MKIQRAAKYGMWGIVAWDEQGREWLLRRQFKADSVLLGRTLERIREKMEIDPKFWKQRTGFGLEAA